MPPFKGVCFWTMQTSTPLGLKNDGFQQKTPPYIFANTVENIEKSGGEIASWGKGRYLIPWFKRRVLSLIAIHYTYARSLTTCPPSVSIATKQPTPGPYQATLVPTVPWSARVVPTAGRWWHAAPSLRRRRSWRVASFEKKKDELCEVFGGWMNETI